MRKFFFYKFSLFLFLYLFAIPMGKVLAEKEKEYILALEDSTGKTLYSVELKNNSEFAIRFIHSVAKTPVTDFFIVRDGQIILDKTIYHDFGAGLPHNPEEGQKMKTEDGEISITGFNRIIPELAVRVGRVAEHALLLFEDLPDNKKRTSMISLDTLAKPGSVILFRIHPAQ